MDLTQGQVCPHEDIWHCLETVLIFTTGERVLLASQELKPEMLLNRERTDPTTKNYLALNLMKHFKIGNIISLFKFLQLMTQAFTFIFTLINVIFSGKIIHLVQLANMFVNYSSHQMG